MSRAWNRINDLEELNHKLEQTIHNLHSFAGRLAGLHDKREVAALKPGNNTIVDRPRSMFFAELDLSLSRIAGNLGFLDSLVSNLDAEVFGELTPAAEEDRTRPVKPFNPRDALEAKAARSTL